MPGPQPKPAWKRAMRWVVFALCVGLFLYALTKTDLRAGWARIVAIGPIVLLVLLPFPVALASDATAWRRLLAALERKVPARVIVRVRLSTEAVSMSTPGGAIWAEALAPVLIARRGHVRLSDVIAASTARRWLIVRMHGAYVAGAAFFGVPALSRASRQLVGSDALVLAVLVGALCLILLSMGFETLTARGRVAGRVSDWLGGTRFLRIQSWIEARRHHFTDADAAVTALSKDRHALRTASAGLLGLWLVEGFETFLILHLLGADLGLATVMSFDAALSVVRSAALFAPAGIGVQDFGYLTVLDAYGVPASSGIAPAFIVLKRMKEAFWIIIGYVLLGFTPVRAAHHPPVRE
jgi:Lysylphosphatidylglycerol synthase TM region